MCEGIDGVERERERKEMHAGDEIRDKEIEKGKEGKRKIEMLTAQFAKWHSGPQG